jgi:hypothetical protein
MGLRSTLASWAALLWRDVPYGGIQIALYEAVRASFRSFCGGGVALDVWAGAVAGSIAAVVTTPADVLVTRMTAQNPQSYVETRRFMSPWATAKRILAADGLDGLWSGALQRGLYYAPLIAVFFVCYEWAKAAILTPQHAISALASLPGIAWCGSRLLARNVSVRFGTLYPLLFLAPPARPQACRTWM